MKLARLNNVTRPAMPTSAKSTYHAPPPDTCVVRERDIEEEFIEKLRNLKYTHRPDIRGRAALERNFRQKFEELKHLLV